MYNVVDQLMQNNHIIIILSLTSYIMINSLNILSSYKTYYRIFLKVQYI